MVDRSAIKILFFSGGANGPIEKWRSYKGKIHSGELSGRVVKLVNSNLNEFRFKDSLFVLT